MVTNNLLTGTISSNFSKWVNINIFAVQYNYLDGTFPPELGLAWKSIHIFTARSNNITGTLPPEYGNWSNLATFQVAANPFLYGTLPESYGSWTSAESIIIFGTNISVGDSNIVGWDDSHKEFSTVPKQTEWNAAKIVWEPHEPQNSGVGAELFLWSSSI